MTVVTPTDRPKSVRNRCSIEVFVGVFVLSIGFRIFCWYRGFRHRPESDLLRNNNKLSLFKFGSFITDVIVRVFVIKIKLQVTSATAV